jgi:hypothetical protein
MSNAENFTAAQGATFVIKKQEYAVWRSAL